jgi:hypothetical protein
MLVLSIVTMEYALLNVGGVAHVKTSKICKLQLRGWLRVWEEGVCIVSFYTL